MFMKYNLAVRAKSLPKVFGARWAEQCLSNAYVTTIHCVSASSRVAGGSPSRHACAPRATGQSTSPACARRAAAAAATSALMSNDAPLIACAHPLHGRGLCAL